MTGGHAYWYGTYMTYNKRAKHLLTTTIDNTHFVLYMAWYFLTLAWLRDEK